MPLRAGLLQTALSAKVEAADRTSGNNFARDELAFELAFATPIGESWNVLLTTRIAEYDYDNVHTGFMVVREDDEWRQAVRAAYTLNEWLSLVMSLTYTNHGSNIPVFEYDRLVTQMGILVRK